MRVVKFQHMKKIFGAAVLVLSSSALLVLFPVGAITTAYAQAALPNIPVAAQPTVGSANSSSASTGSKSTAGSPNSGSDPLSSLSAPGGAPVPSTGPTPTTVPKSTVTTVKTTTVVQNPIQELKLTPVQRLIQNVATLQGLLYGATNKLTGADLKIKARLDTAVATQGVNPSAITSSLSVAEKDIATANADIAAVGQVSISATSPLSALPALQTADTTARAAIRQAQTDLEASLNLLETAEGVQ